MGWIRKLFNIKDKVQPITVDDDNFEEEILKSDVPVLLDVWTPSCVHCDRLVPIIVGLATRYQGKLKVAEINGAEAPIAMSSLKVRGTPTVVYFVEGREFERVVGFRGSLYHQDLIENELLPSTMDPQLTEADPSATMSTAT